MTDTVPPFTESHATLLRTFLSSPQRPTGTMTYPQLAGFLFSIANGPELILPSEWMPMVFNDRSAGYKTQHEAEGVTQAMMALYNDCARERTEESASLPPGCEFLPVPLDNLADDAVLSQWAQGFSMGHDYLEDIWKEFTPDELDEDLGSVLMVLTFFSSPKLARAYHKEGVGKKRFEQLAETVVSIFPDAMHEYAHLGRSMYQARREAGALGTEPPGAGNRGQPP
jgi:yecA family protein